MKYFIPRGTNILRTTQMFEVNGANWERVKSVRDVTYEDADLVENDNAYYIFRLSALAAPYIRMAVRKNKVVELHPNP